MYLARFDTDEGEWIQAVAWFHASAALRGPSSLWWDEIGRGLERSLRRISQGTIARRIEVDERRQLRQSISIATPSSAEDQVRDLFASFTRLERILGGSLELPATAEQHDAWTKTAPRLRYAPVAESFSAGGVPIACDFRIAPILDDILVDAALNAYAFAYQIHILPISIPAQQIAAARKAALALRGRIGVPDALADRQDTLAREAAQARAIAEEVVMVDTASAGAAVRSMLSDRFQLQFRTFGFTMPDFEFQPEAFDESVSVGVHSHLLSPMAPAHLCGAALTAAEQSALLSWRPSTRLQGLLVLQPDPTESESELMPPDEAVLRNGPRPYDGDGEFAFVSYKRHDFAAIAPILRLVEEYGMHVWYDRGIPGGAEWDAIIEERLSRSRVVIVFLSGAAVASKYVRREVKFADALNTPVLSVLLEDAPLTHGLQMMLTQYQILDARAPDFATRLRDAIARF